MPHPTSGAGADAHAGARGTELFPLRCAGGGGGLSSSCGSRGSDTCAGRCFARLQCQAGLPGHAGETSAPAEAAGTIGVCAE